MLDSIKVQILTKKSHFKAFFYVSYDMYDFTIQYDTIHTIRTLYRMIHEHLRYADTIQNFFHMIRYVLYDMYRVSYDTDNHEQSG